MANKNNRKTNNNDSNDITCFGDYIVSYRLCHELSQTALAQILGISKQRLCDIEKNRGNIGIQLAQGMADRLGLSKDKLVKLAIRDRIEKEGLGHLLSDWSTPH
jgi:transcriptional regulator with XRE-family HTH domain